MKITKYEHACLFIESGDGTLIIDPGSFTTLPEELNNVVAVVVTEEHYDHFDVDNLKHIIQQNPQVTIYTTVNVSKELAENEVQSTVVTGEKTFHENDFVIKLTEVDHAAVYKTSPCKSLTVQINNYLYYPSDSYETTPDSVEILALPTSGPWYKVSESIDFANKIKSKYVITTHNAINSDAGNSVTNKSVGSNLNDNRELIHLTPGQSFSDK